MNWEGEKCELAVDIKGDKYYVIGAHIDSFGDAHSENGFCNAILDADIQGAINVGMDSIFVNHLQIQPTVPATHTITHLKELENIF